jgi:hypothetical protein
MGATRKRLSNTITSVATAITRCDLPSGLCPRTSIDRHAQVARHWYRFSTPTDLTQTFAMECTLCGRGAEHVDNSQFARPLTDQTSVADVPDVTLTLSLDSLCETIQQRVPDEPKPSHKSASCDEWED